LKISVHCQMIKWFAANNFVQNLGKRNIMKFVAKNSSHSALHIGYKEKCVEGTMNTIFLGLNIDINIIGIIILSE